MLAQVIGAQQPVEHAEPIGPERLVERQPVVGQRQWNWVQPADVGATRHLPPNQPGCLENLDVFGRRRQR